MTLAQLQSFVLVARHGSVKAAAAELEVTEPAVSVAVAALRKELGDELFVRSGRGIALTPGGRRLAALASEILGLAEQARRSVPDSPGESRRLQAGGHQPRRRAHRPADRHVHGARGRAGGLGRVGSRRLVRRSARAPAGGHRARPAPRAGARRDDRLGAVPALPADHRRRAGARAGGAARDRARHARARALAGRASRTSTRPPAAGLFLARNGLDPSEVATYSNHAAAIAAAAAGEGIALTLSHSVVDEVRRRALVRLDVRGTPVVELWHASTLGLGRALPAALALQRFATTSDATQTLSTGRAGAVSTRVRPKVHVTLWRSVAEEIDAAAKR